MYLREGMPFVNFVKKMYKHYISMPVAVKASVWFALCNFMQKGINILTIPIFTRLLTTEQYGVYTIYQSWYNLIYIFATLNLAAGVFNNGMIKFENERNRYTSALNGLSMTVTAILFAIYLLRYKLFNELLGLPTLLVVAMFVELMFSPAFSLWSARQRFDYRYRGLVAITLIMSVLSPVIGVGAVLISSHKAEARVLSYVGVQVCIGIVLCAVNFYKGKSFYVKSFWKYALWFNIPLIPHYLSMSVLGQADRIMIGKMVGLSQAAIYGLAYNISQMMNLLTTAVNSSFIPYSYKAMKNKKYKDIGKNANVLLLMWACMLVIIICFGPEIIRIFASPAYYEARWIIPPVALSVYFTFLYTLFGNVEFYYEANKFIMIASVFGAIVNIILNYIFIPIFGYIAAGYTTLFCYILFSVSHYLFHIKVLNKMTDGVRVYDMKFIVLISAALVMFALSVVFVYDMIIVRYAIIAAICIVMIIKRNYFIEKIKAIRKS